MGFLRQIWTLTQKDIRIVAQKRWFSTFVRAVAFPIVLVIVLSYIRIWTATPGHHGLGNPLRIRTFAQALDSTGSTRPDVVIINNGFTDGDIGQVIDELSTAVRNSPKKRLHVVSSYSEVPQICTSSSKGISNCFGAVEFLGSPGHGSRLWNFTMYGDSGLGGSIDVNRDDNDYQLYSYPFKQAVDSAIDKASGGPGISSPAYSWPFTSIPQTEIDAQDLRTYMQNIEYFLAFAFFICLCGLTYHCVGHITYQREQGMLQLIDAMMPNPRFQCIVSRMIATHAAFDAVYLIGWIVIGAVMGSVAFTKTPVGYFILLNVLGGLALTSYSILASSLFKRAQLSAISAIVAALVFALVAQFAEQDGVLGASLTGVLATAVLFPPSAYVYFLAIASSFEQQGLPMSLGASPLGRTAWSTSCNVFIGCLVFQIVVYPWLAVLIETYLHGTSSSARKTSNGNDLSGNAVVLQNFTKVFKSKVNKGQKVTAVDSLNLKIHAGSITVLLGANGSGKSTTLNSIAGLETITGGNIFVDNTGGIGICPQHNIMFDELTVREHISFFEKLKRTSTASRLSYKEEVDKLIEGCDLSLKRSARAKTLSGGQKRKLQLAMMLAGGSRVCCIDEASSGIDPIARRKVWDILLAERGHRSLLLTTHFLDEAEVLSDHVGILSKGVLKAEGPVASLKSSMGGGYRVTVDNDPRLSSIPNLPSRQSDYNHTVFELVDASALANFLSTLEQHGIHDYRLQGPTIEQVFLKLAHEMQGDSEMAKHLTIDGVLNGRIHSGTSSDPNGKAGTLALDTGRGCNPMKQTWFLFRKRLTILKHNYMPYVAAMFVALTLAGVVTRFFSGYQFSSGVPCADPNAENSEYQYRYVLDWTQIAYSQAPIGPPNQISPSRIRSLLPSPSSTYSSYGDDPTQYLRELPKVGSLSSFDNYIRKNYTRLFEGGVFDDPDRPTFAWVGDIKSSSPLDFIGLLDSVITNRTMEFGFQEFGTTYSPSIDVTILVAIFTVLGFSLYPGFFALYPTAERLRNVRKMHYSNGIHSSSLWLAYLLFDMIFILLISVLTVVIWITQWSGWYGLGYMFVVFFLYGITSTAYSYVVSLFVPSQLAAIAASSVIQVIFSMLYFAGYFLTSSNAPSTDIYSWFNYIHYTIALISPSASLLRALFICLNVYALTCEPGTTGYYSYPGRLNLYGAPILYLTVQFVLLAAFLMYWESGKSLEVFGIRRKQKVKQEQDTEKTLAAEEADAAEDPSRLAETNNGLRIHHVSKSFGKVLAVDDVSFGVLPSEKHALLGPNGAGKSTLLNLLRGDIRPTHPHRSDIVISNDSLMQAPVAAKNHLGVCPQFDAVDTMTLKEHLTFYARARGVRDREGNINELITRLGLTEHKNKLVRKLSGGTQRKLSLAIALIANPKVLLLDEPSSGMDAAAKRALWSTLSSIVDGRVLLITTHSMEEADALCDRAAIMAGRLLALGSIDELRDRHGKSLHLHLVHKDAPHTSVEDGDRIKQWVLQALPGAQIERRIFGGQLRLSVPRSNAVGNDLARLFKMIEEVKGDLGITDYSIGPATLDQVFLNVVERHNVQEENTETKKSKKWRFPWSS